MRPSSGSLSPDVDDSIITEDAQNTKPFIEFNNLRPLTRKQERKLMDHLEERFLDLTRNYKKRYLSEVSSTLPTLSSYLQATRIILSLVLQIPPLDPSTSLRTAYLLRLTNDIMHSIPGYLPDTDTLPELLEWLDVLDRGWLAVLHSQAWDPVLSEGVDVILTPGAPIMRSSPVTQTERTRLRSLLVTGTGTMEEWMESLDTEEEDYNSALERLGLQSGFDQLFFRSLTAMGGLGSAASDPAGMVG
ncbi:hypothetical protein HETIRDRAFT_311022 [Heterobasidion irregulare TC 32-1]|uniref:Uncharacterized protein n=1 Tax=Heterobasidion irregulare (strain TC 32-1) TaxID=747525 RepID=W4KH84_HETIT|nr:uncharacterized protein HETIRDRAFT_311022 [Heterobasidion irregulare TC 32-1]ETW85079.1 hypothetical protein HETIRDRAFT_311022 [Heterobasidion irregulare TC 32-1]